jgi:hypothetical protein
VKETEAAAPDVIRLPPAPGGPIDASAIEDAVRDWVTSPAFTALVADFHGPPVQNDLACYLEALDRFSAVWDFRGGKERDAAPPVDMSEASERRILDAARVLGLRDSFEYPQAKRYDHCLVLGGKVRACVTRPAWAAELASSGIQFGDVTALGGFRVLARDELALAQTAGMNDVVDELHAMEAGIRRAFSVKGDPLVDGEYDPSNPNRSWAVHRFRADELRVAVAAAPSTQPHVRRANTADSYAWWAKNIGSLTADHCVLLVTTSIYVPFQHADAIRVLAAVYGCAVETVGAPAEWTVGGISPYRFEATNYLQEIRSAIRAMRRLVDFMRQI